MAITHSVHAIVTLTVQIEVGDSWGPECTSSQVFKQASESALGILRHPSGSDGRITVIGTPRVESVIHAKADR